MVVLQSLYDRNKEKLCGLSEVL